MGKLTMEKLTRKLAAPLPMITSDQNNYDLGEGTFFSLTSDAKRKISGLICSGSVNIGLVNAGEFNILLLNQSELSDPPNRVMTGNGEDLILATDDTALLSFDSEIPCWRLTA